MRALVYVDSLAVAPAAVVVGKALQSGLAAKIVVLAVTSTRSQIEVPPDFLVYDLGEPSEWRERARDDAPPPVAEPRAGKVGRRVEARKVVRAAAAPIKWLLLRFRLARDIRAVVSTRSFLKRIKAFLEFSKPDVIVTFEDNIETPSRILVETGRRMGMPAIVIPYTIPNPLEPATPLVATGERTIGRLLERALSAFRSSWVFRVQGQRILRLPLIRVLGIESMGLSVPQPWILNSGSARAIALDSRAARRAYLDLGFPNEQLEIVGDTVGEQLHEGLSHRPALRQRLAAENRLESPQRPLVVCAFPPDQYRGTETSAYEIPSFQELVSTWMELLLEISRHANVLVRPHPRLAPEPLKLYETPHLRITSQPTAEIVPAADLYVASISATIRWAIACGIPVINYDCYRYRYDDYRTAEGVVTVYAREEFREVSTRYFSDASFAAHLKDRQQAVMADWGLLDDGFPGRLADLVHRVVLERGSAGPSDSPASIASRDKD